jgi:hypothetical protein
VALFVDMGQGAGLAGATGVRPFLPPLLAGALARNDSGLDFDGTGWEFLESPWFLFAILALTVVSYWAERSRTNERWRARATLFLSVLLGALLFAGSLAEGGEDAWWGVIVGAGCALLGALALGGVFDRARARLQGGAANLITLYADGAAIGLAAIAIVVPPVSYAALAAFLLLLIRMRGEEDEKYAGLRILR